MICFWLPVMWLISIGYSLTNKRKTAISDKFWAFFGHCILSSPKRPNLIDSAFQGHWSSQIISVYGYSEPFLMRGSLRIIFTFFRTVIIFLLSFPQLLIFRMRWKSPNLFVLECIFHWWKPFCSIYNSLQKWTIKIGFQIDQFLNFMLLLLCYVNTRDKVVPKSLIPASWLVHIPT